MADKKEIVVSTYVVRKNYTDKEYGTKHKAGDIVSLTAERAAEIDAALGGEALAKILA
ncbi:MAG: hypothetical protein LBN00_09960 [Oscillospiraceae bacterium]|jgi:hypothetical protein|nr:hypothetical protein [Oscillospiraceae bacterium]